MKKITTFLMALLAITMATQAQTILLEESFEGKSLPKGWTIIDNDRDGNNWIVDDKTGFWGHGGKETRAARSASYIDKAITPDNFLVTPKLDLSKGGVLSFWVCSQEVLDPAEHYAVYASAAGNTVADFTAAPPLHEETLTEKTAARTNVKAVDGALRAQTAWHERIVKIPAGTKYLAFRHFNCTGQDHILIDDVKITGEKDNGKPDPTDSKTLPYTETFESCLAGALPKGWTVKDLDGDGLGWATSLAEAGSVGHNSRNCIISYSWVIGGKKIIPNNHLISPRVDGVKSINFYVSASDAEEFKEHYKIFASSKDIPSEEADWKKIFEETLTKKAAAKGTEDNERYQYREMNVPEGTKQIKFVHVDCTDQYALRLDDITFSPWLASTEGIQAERVKLAIEKGIIVVDTPTADTTLCVFDLEGRCIAKQTTVTGKNRVAVKAGYYVLSVGGFNGKVYVP